jgi:SpoVK/Ycf46/Vps4 family AAA+-type ATPase
MPFAEKTEGYTGAEIEVVIRKAYELCCDAGEDTINSERLFEAVEKCRPNTHQIEFMTELAIRECDDADMLAQSASGHVGVGE